MTDGFISRMWEKCGVQKAWARELLEKATIAVQLGTSWQDASLHKEELEVRVK